MPFSPQPQKKGVQSPQDEPEVPSCGHSSSKKGCPACVAAAAKAKAHPKPDPKIVDLPTEKMKITRLREKIADSTANDRRFDDKAALVLSNWINQKKK